MARSIRAAGGAEPAGTFEQRPSQAHFTIRNEAGESRQTIEYGNGVIQSFPLSYVVGSGSHATGGIVRAGDHLFQSPLSYYTQRRAWDMAPGYEGSAEPDFSRPVTVECLACHADKPRPMADTLNSYQSPSLEGYGISCDRCHGPADAHLSKPTPGTILNPAKLAREARDSICEQCHLTGEIRIPNPGKSITDFTPGESLESTYSVYVTRQQSAENSVKVVSQAEQLALSLCARKSEGKLWCGTCHDPHETPARPAEYYRAKCLGCHSTGTLRQSHTAALAATGDCVACHMTKRPAKDGGHTAFTDHRISRRPQTVTIDEANNTLASGDLAAWREPAAALRDRNLALALTTAGLQNHVPEQVIRGYRMLNRLEATAWRDAAVETALGTILLTAKQPGEATVRFERALAARPGYAPYEVNLASALLDGGKTTEAIGHLERAVQLDPLLKQAVELLAQAYAREGQRGKADALTARYRAAMHYGQHE